MDNEQALKDVIKWLITTKNTEMLDESDVDLVYKDYIASQGGNIPPVNTCPQLSDVKSVVNEIRKRITEDKEKLKMINANTQISGHIRCELIAREVLRDYEKGERFL